MLRCSSRSGEAFKTNNPPPRSPSIHLFLRTLPIHRPGYMGLKPAHASVFARKLPELFCYWEGKVDGVDGCGVHVYMYVYMYVFHPWRTRMQTGLLQHLGQILPVQGLGRGLQRMEKAEEVWEGHGAQVIVAHLVQRHRRLEQLPISHHHLGLQRHPHHGRHNSYKQNQTRRQEGQAAAVAAAAAYAAAYAGSSATTHDDAMMVPCRLGVGIEKGGG